MNTSELKQKLLEEGCNPNNFCIGSSGVMSDVYCLSENYGKWSIFYTERGLNSKPIYESRNEAEACEFYYNQIMAIEHWHNVGFFESDEPALKLQQELEFAGIKAIRNDMPPLKAGGPNIRRVFVIGKDIFKVKDMYASLPLKNA
ncbi:MAG: SPOR domain-containing protein [Gammaproteobacteria bacterium]|nr:SPOR domain-containing protein [Gammaproteobacteria bacterium]